MRRPTRMAVRKTRALAKAAKANKKAYQPKMIVRKKRRGASARSHTYRELIFKSLLDHQSFKGTSMPALVQLVHAQDSQDRFNLVALKRAVARALDDGELGFHKRYSRSLVLNPTLRKSLRRKNGIAAPRVRTVATSKVSKNSSAKRKNSSGSPPSSKKVKLAKKPSKQKVTKKTKLPSGRNTASSVGASNGQLCDLIDENLDPQRFKVVSTTDGFYDCMLVLRDLSKNMDKYYKMQLLLDSHSCDWLVQVRFGRTGTVGQSQEHRFAQLEDATDKFETQFKSKTGQEWSFQPSHSTQPPQMKGKYQIIRKVYSTEEQREAVRKQEGGEPVWQYFVGDGVDGKATGWYDYDDVASHVVEGIFTEWLHNNQLGVRCVDSGMWQYSVSFNEMTQTNIKHPNHTQRKIRRSVKKDHN